MSLWCLSAVAGVQLALSYTNYPARLPPCCAVACTYLPQDALLVQKLFRLVFLGLTLADGESLLVPTLVQLVGKCLTAATQQRDPLAYLQLLRILFKHCHASRWAQDWHL